MYQPKLEDLKSRDSLLNINESHTFVKVIAEAEDEPRLYLASSMTEGIGASLTPFHVALLHDALGVWLRAVAAEQGDEILPEGELQQQARKLLDEEGPDD